METTVFEIELTDGRIFRIFCANRSQKDRFRKSLWNLKPITKTVKEITNGINTINQWEITIETFKY